MNAANVHGASAVFERISRKFGLRGQYGPCTEEDVGMATESGLVGGEVSSVDMERASSSVSVSPAATENTDGGYLEDFVEVDVVSEKSDDGFRTTITFWKRDLLSREARREGLRRVQWM